MGRDYWLTLWYYSTGMWALLPPEVLHATSLQDLLYTLIVFLWVVHLITVDISGYS